MKKITIVLTSMLTVPAIKGGAVEQLLEDFLIQNESKKKFECTVIAHYIPGVEKHLSKYKLTKFKYIKYPTLLMRINSVVKNKLVKIPDIYKNILVKAVLDAGNKDILVEGSREFAIELKKSYPELRVYLHTHGPAYPFKNKADAVIYKNLNRIITVSDFCKNQQIKDLGVPKEKVVTVKNGIVCSKFHPENILDSEFEIRKKYNLPENKKIILFKGRMVREKGIVQLIKAFSQIENNDILLLIVGSKNFGEKRLFRSKYESELMRIIKRDKRIKHIGYVPYEDIPKLNKVSYMCVVPSLWDEPAGLVVLESIASETPLIISDAGGMSEYVDTKYVDIIVRDNHFIENLKKSMIHLLNNESQYKSMVSGIKKVRNYYNEERYYESLCKVLE